MNKKGLSLIGLVALSCVIMGIVDAVIQPGYAMKSLIKVGLFLMIPASYAYFDKACDLKGLFIPRKKGVSTAVLLGVAIYFFILIAYFLVKDIFDFSEVTTTLTTNMQVSQDNFVFVALYISFINSLLEEFFFRGFAFLSLKRVTTRRFAYLFSAIMFALYHIAMMIGWFSIEVIVLALIGLVVGGFIFNWFNEANENIYTSWLIHMCANFAINTVGFILFGII